jgi:hypothetical protein
LTHSDEIPRWECSGKGCNWEYLDPYAADHAHRCTACGARLGRKPSQTVILVAGKRHWGADRVKELEQQAHDDEFAAVGDMERAGWKRGEARQWYRRRAKSHAGVPT